VETDRISRRSDSFRYLFVGRLIERKGIETLLKAFRELKSGELWIVGDGPLVDSVKEAARGDRRVRWFAHAGGGDLVRLYRSVDAVVVPSVYDVWSLVVNEAQTFGLPVIASDQVGAAADRIEHGLNGLIVPAGQALALRGAMRELARWTANQRDRCATLCQRLCESNTADRSAEAMVRACSHAVDHRRRRLRMRGS